MFGLNDNNTQSSDNKPVGVPDAPLSAQQNPFGDNSSPPPITPTTPPTPGPSLPPFVSSPIPEVPSLDAAPMTNAPMTSEPMASSPMTSEPMPTEPTVSPPLGPISPAPADNDLLDLKQQALQNLQPLVSHLDQSPEEKFKTTMMMIQATDNSALVKEAYAAANQIIDEKARAQALLDVVNEINYFTHSKNDSTEAKD